MNDDDYRIDELESIIHDRDLDIQNLQVENNQLEDRITDLKLIIKTQAKQINEMSNIIKDLEAKRDNLQEERDEIEDQKSNAYYVRDKEIRVRRKAEDRLYELEGLLSDIEFESGIDFERLSVSDHARLIELLQDF